MDTSDISKVIYFFNNVSLLIKSNFEADGYLILTYIATEVNIDNLRLHSTQEVKKKNQKNTNYMNNIEKGILNVFFNLPKVVLHYAKINLLFTSLECEPLQNGQILYHFFFASSSTTMMVPKDGIIQKYVKEISDIYDHDIETEYSHYVLLLFEDLTECFKCYETSSSPYKGKILCKYQGVSKEELKDMTESMRVENRLATMTKWRQNNFLFLFRKAMCNEKCVLVLDLYCK